MGSPALVKPTHKAIVAYYQTLQAYGEHDVEHETALRSAFQNLLAETAKPHGWLLVPEQRTRVGGKTVIPDVTVCDEYNLHRGYWEAKDTDDNFDTGIKRRSPRATRRRTRSSRTRGRRSGEKRRKTVPATNGTVRVRFVVQH